MGIELPAGVADPRAEKEALKAELTKEQKELLARMAEENPPSEEETEEGQGIPVATAFLVLIHPDNTVQVSPDANIDIVLERYPTPADLKHGCREVVSQIDRADIASIVAPSTVQILLDTMNRLQQQQGAMNLASATQQGFDPRLLKGGL